MPILHLPSTPQDSLLKYIQFRMCCVVNTRLDLALTVKKLQLMFKSMWH